MEQLPLTLLVAHRLQEQPKAQVQTSGKMKTYGGSRTQRANILNSQIVFCQNSTCSFWTNCPYKERFRHCFVTERKRQWKVREALKAINHRTPRGNIKIWAKDTGRERQLCQLEEDSFLCINFSTNVNNIFSLPKKNCDSPLVENKIGLTLPNLQKNLLRTLPSQMAGVISNLPS